MILAMAAVLSQDKSQAEKTVFELTQKLRAAPTAELWHARAAARIEMEDPVGALADISEAVRLAPFEAGYRLVRARLTAGQGRWQ